MDLIRTLAETRKIGFMLITHDIGVIAQIADTCVMYTWSAPYTVALMAAVPPLDHKRHYVMYTTAVWFGARVHVAGSLSTVSPATSSVPREPT